MNNSDSITHKDGNARSLLSYNIKERRFSDAFHNLPENYVLPFQEYHFDTDVDLENDY